MAELIDIYDANLNRIGAMERGEAHRRGEWHKTFHCWVVGGQDEGSLLFQLRSQSVNFPGLLDVSAAGHLEAGEPVEAGIREVIEELGIEISIHNLVELGYRVEVADQSNGQKNREYQAVYLLRHDAPLTAFRPQVEEIAGLFWLGLDECIELFSNQRPIVQVEGIVYDKDALSWRTEKRQVTNRDFLPRIQRYYLTASIMAMRFLNNQFPLSIS